MKSPFVPQEASGQGSCPLSSCPWKRCLLVAHLTCPKSPSIWGAEGCQPLVKGCVLSLRPRTKPGDTQQIRKEDRKPGSPRADLLTFADAENFYRQARRRCALETKAYRDTSSQNQLRRPGALRGAQGHRKSAKPPLSQQDATLLAGGQRL